MLRRLRHSWWVLLLPLLLLVAQQGELDHHVVHAASEASSCHETPSSGEHCLECLGYAQIGGLASCDVPSPVLLGGLSFRSVAAREIASTASLPLAPRSRGPPLT